MAVPITIPDEYGNELIITDNGDTIDVMLYFESELKQPRHQGTIYKERRAINVKYIRGLALNHKHQAYPLNYKLLSETKKFDVVELSDEITSWNVPVKYILNNGKLLLTKQNGFEKQIFISLEDLKQFENSLPNS